MAQRTVARLKQRQMVLVRRLGTGGCIYVLSERGAHFLRELGVENVSSRGHRDLTFDKPLHRMVANDFVIDRHLEGWRIWTEFEVQRALAPVPEIYVRTSSRKGLTSRRKIPDAVIETDNFVTWIEVENTPKNKARLNQLMVVADMILPLTDIYNFSWHHEDFYMDEMLFVLPNDASYRALIRAVRRANLPDKVLRQVRFARVEMTQGLIWKGTWHYCSAAEILSTSEC